MAWAALFGCGPWVLLGMFLTAGMVAVAGRGDAGGVSGPRVGLIHVRGAITAGDGQPAGILGGGSAGSERLVELLEKAAENENIKAIVVRVDSPGGSPVGSHEVYNEILRIRREEKKPVVVSMGDVAASGGYYIASAADHIFANPGTLTGSIGVIMQLPQLQDLMNRFGVNMAVIKSGKFKDVGNPARELSPEERQLLQTMIMEIYDQFVTAVVEGRNLPREQVLKVADGRIMTGSQALRYKLVDELGGLKQAVAYAGKKGGIEGEPKVEEIGKRGLLQDLLGVDAGVQSGGMAESAQVLRLLTDPRVQAVMKELLSAPQAQPRF